MNYLIMDTATDIMYLAVVKKDNTFKERIRISKKDISKFLVDEISELLTSANLTINDINGIILGKGPGSYTGLRISGTVAKTFCYAKSIPLYTISSLYLMTSGYDKVLAMIDARNDLVFGGLYHDGKKIIEDGHFNKNELLSKAKGSDIVLITKDNYKVNVFNVIKYSKLENNSFDYVPNYINKTEAERNHEDK